MNCLETSMEQKEQLEKFINRTQSQASGPQWRPACSRHLPTLANASAAISEPRGLTNTKQTQRPTTKGLIF